MGNKMTEYSRYVTHVIVPDLPKEGFDQIFYYTVKDKTMKDGKFYWGRGNNSFDKDYLNELLVNNKIQKINTKIYPFPIKDNESLWVDKYGVIYKADINDPLISTEKISRLEIEVKK
jgi:hypothetical protein